MPDRSHTDNSYEQLGLTAICAAGLFSVLYLMKGLYPFGDGSIMMTDLYSQYVPLLYRFYDVVTGQKNLFLDFRVSGGANLYADTINEVINPFNYVLLPFGREMIYKAVNVLLLLYVTGAAVSANCFLLKIWPGRREWNVVLSLCYALSGYTAYNFQIIKWMYFPVLFPLFALSVRRLLQKGKGGVYALLLAYQLALSIQLGFMTLLFTLFASGIYFYTIVKKEDRPPAMCRLGLYTLAGVLLSGGVWAPNVYILLSSSRAGENLSYLGVMKRHGLDDLFERLFQIAHPALLALASYPAVRAIRQRRRFGNLTSQGRFWIILNAFLWLTVLLQPANLLWHMGSYVCFPVRYAYMVLLCEVGLVKWMLQETVLHADNAGRRKKRMGIAVLGTVLCCLWALGLTLHWEERIVQAFSSLAISKTCPKETLMALGICVLLWAAGIFAGFDQKGKSRRMLLVAAACGICLNGFIFLPRDYGVRLENEAAYRKMTRQEPGGVLDRVKEEPGLPLNAALVNGQSSLSGYFPTAGRQFKNAMEDLGYLVPWVATQSVGGTAVSDDLLSMAFVSDKTADELQLQGESVLERQEKLSELTAGEKVFTRFDGTQLKKDGNGTFYLTAEGTQSFYLDPGMTANCLQIYVNGTLLDIPEPGAAYSPHRIVELGTFSEEEAAVLVTDQSGRAIAADGMEFAVLDVVCWEEALEGVRRLEADQLTVEESGGRIVVNCSDAKEDQTVFLPFAALDGWSAVRNGETVDIRSVFGGFMGIKAAEGDNEIVLRFIPPGLKTGLALMLAGAALLAGMAAAGRSHGKREAAGGQGGGCVEQRAAAAWSRLYRGVLAIALAAVYAIPAAGLLAYLMGKVLGIGG